VNGGRGSGDESSEKRGEIRSEQSDSVRGFRDSRIQGAQSIPSISLWLTRDSAWGKAGKMIIEMGLAKIIPGERTKGLSREGL